MSDSVQVGSRPSVELLRSPPRSLALPSPSEVQINDRWVADRVRGDVAFDFSAAIRFPNLAAVVAL